MSENEKRMAPSIALGAILFFGFLPRGSARIAEPQGKLYSPDGQLATAEECSAFPERPLVLFPPGSSGTIPMRRPLPSMELLASMVAA